MKKYFPALNDAQRALVEQNVKLVGYLLQRNHWAVLAYQGSKEDAVADGYIALMSAAYTYDPERGVQFSTYACQCIRKMWVNHKAHSEHDCRKANTHAVSLETSMYREKQHESDQSDNDLCWMKSLSADDDVEESILRDSFTQYVIRVAKERVAESRSQNKERDFDAWYCHCIKGEKGRSLAKRYGVSPSCIHANIRLLNQRIRETLEKEEEKERGKNL